MTRSNLQRLAKDYANNKLDYEDYRAQRTILIDHTIEETSQKESLVLIKVDKKSHQVFNKKYKQLSIILVLFLFIITLVFIFYPLIFSSLANFFSVIFIKVNQLINLL